jgi:hypothetical protein
MLELDASQTLDARINIIDNAGSRRSEYCRS